MSTPSDNCSLMEAKPYNINMSTTCDNYDIIFDTDQKHTIINMFTTCDNYGDNFSIIKQDTIQIVKCLLPGNHCCLMFDTRYITLYVICLLQMITVQRFPGRYFRCELSGSCIPKKWRCDGDSDCGPGDRTDELNCSALLGWKCDGEFDCGADDTSDEKDCEADFCSYNEYECKSGECIPLNWTCDKEYDCSDGSDESEVICSL
ncbi:CD91 [Mytilus edulis]|uniref:LRP1 n=1 Tax=Mytilus edulis TaxID=6550 RepID=A0A8S3PZF7_MYTED|nr:CD91 [Mytilus edulis]